MTRDARRPGLVVNGTLAIPPDELEARATRSGGPGGQHVNTSSTRVELIWRVAESRSISESQRALIRDKLAGRLDADGNLRVVASDTRSQLRNRSLAESRLAALVAGALAVPKPRRRTKPTKASVERRLTEKRQRSQRKSDRRTRDAD
ncbi:MAG: alternative ribosome rescue aminoacyl-tRNA hydrolase ArfB [Gemmatimonadetes bacterium]|nr:alternative ribosome rescue aminoacyl-tRNA hydrolase ArfB [Gemmatimonadota bacterium]